MSQNVLVVALVILPMLGLACLSVAENLEESGLDGWFTASLFQGPGKKEENIIRATAFCIFAFAVIYSTSTQTP